MSDAIALSLPVVISYFIALVVYLGCTFGFAKMAGRQLSADGRPLPGFWAATGISWLFATIAATYYTVVQAPYPIEMLFVTVALIVVIINSAIDFRGQQPNSIPFMSVGCVLLGSGIVWKLVH